MSQFIELRYIFFVLILVQFLVYSHVNCFESNKNQTKIVPDQIIENEPRKLCENITNNSSLTGAICENLLEMTILVKHLTSKLIQQESKGVLGRLFGHVTNVVDIVLNNLSGAGQAFTHNFSMNMIRQMNRVKNELLELAFSLDTRFDEAVKHLNESLIHHTTSIDLWAENFKNTFHTFYDTDVYNKRCRAADKFIDKATDALQSCCNITFKPMISLCRSFRQILTYSIKVLADVFQKIQHCLEDKNSYSKYMVPCLKIIDDEISDIIKEARKLRKKIETILPTKILYSSCCISIALVTIEEQRNELAQEIIFNNEY